MHDPAQVQSTSSAYKPHSRHSRESGNPFLVLCTIKFNMDSRFRGNDVWQGKQAGAGRINEV